MKYFVLASGSKGNSTLLDFGSCRILIDCGISKKALGLRLDAYGYQVSDIDYIFLTHDHSDHNKSIKLFPGSMIYTAQGCMDGLAPSHYLIPYDLYEFKDVCVVPLKTSHDATNSMGFLFLYHDEKLVFMTDTGYVSHKNATYMVDADYYIIESNHDIDLLMRSRRPMFLKNRILSDHGHLSNVDSAKLMHKLIGDHTKEIVLAHLSDECNTEDIARETYERILGDQLSMIELKIARQNEVVYGGCMDEN